MNRDKILSAGALFLIALTLLVLSIMFFMYYKNSVAVCTENPFIFGANHMSRDITCQCSLAENGQVSFTFNKSSMDYVKPVQQSGAVYQHNFSNIHFDTED